MSCKFLLDLWIPNLSLGLELKFIPQTQTQTHLLTDYYAYLHLYTPLYSSTLLLYTHTTCASKHTKVVSIRFVGLILMQEEGRYWKFDDYTR